MRILVALIAAFIVTAGSAQMPPKTPTPNMAVEVCFEDAAGLYQCTDPNTGKTQMAKCKTPPK